MSVHRWEKAPTCIFFDFNLAWMAEIRSALNSGILPPPFYAMHGWRGDYRCIEIYKEAGDEVTALIESVLPENKSNQGDFDQLVENALGILHDGLHLQLFDLFPPGPFDPGGMHGVLWSRLGGKYEPPQGKPLTLASYAAAGAVTCYVEPTAVGSKLIDMPLFLTAERYVNVPLELTYESAYEGVPGRWKRVIEAAS